MGRYIGSGIIGAICGVTVTPIYGLWPGLGITVGLCIVFLIILDSK